MIVLFPIYFIIYETTLYFFYSATVTFTERSLKYKINCCNPDAEKNVRLFHSYTFIFLKNYTAGKTPFAFIYPLTSSL